MEVGILRWTDVEAHFTALQLRAPHITELEFDYVDLTSDQLRTVILQAPTITHLNLRHCNYCFDDALVGAFCYEKGVAPVLPHLHNLVLEVDEDKYAFTEANLAGMIASRWWSDAEMAAHSVSLAVAR
ncbi:hypothetical protein K438DRAFT_274457 [Mycena galopus ATCC 62051]|nr:hypothetical protein K438DRAFT_274457 [Mycena galopus ATCC 62051]